MYNIIFKRNVVAYSRKLLDRIQFKEVKKYTNFRLHDSKMRCSNLPIYENKNYDIKSINEILNSSNATLRLKATIPDTFEYQYNQLVND